jgi:hypothetical protein
LTVSAAQAGRMRAGADRVAAVPRKPRLVNPTIALASFRDRRIVRVERPGRKAK